MGVPYDVKSSKTIVCQNEKIGTRCLGGGGAAPPFGSANDTSDKLKKSINLIIFAMVTW